MAERFFSAVRAGGANIFEDSAWNVASEVGETAGVPQSLCGCYSVVPGVPLCSAEASGNKKTI